MFHSGTGQYSGELRQSIPHTVVVKTVNVQPADLTMMGRGMLTGQCGVNWVAGARGGIPTVVDEKKLQSNHARGFHVVKSFPYAGANNAISQEKLRKDCARRGRAGDSRGRGVSAHHGLAGKKQKLDDLENKASPPPKPLPELDLTPYGQVFATREEPTASIELRADPHKIFNPVRYQLKAGNVFVRNPAGGGNEFSRGDEKSRH